MNIIQPTLEQIKNCAFLGWAHLGEGIFENVSTGEMGYFTEGGFIKE